MLLVLPTICIALGGCAQRQDAQILPPPPPVTIVVAPVLNLSNSAEWDALKVTDLLASELQQFRNVTVIPVNRTLAALAESGKPSIQAPADAIALSEYFDADATLVTAVTEYNPYDPPVVGLTMQLYERGPGSGSGAVTAADASRAGPDVHRPRLQVQQVFNAALDSTLRDVQDYAHRREGYASPYDWRIHLKSQEAFARYCCWAALRSMLSERTDGPAATDLSCGTEAGIRSGDR